MANLEIHLPKELTIRPQPLITLAGLDSKRNADHRIIADAFTLNRRSDRLPLNFQVRPIDHDYPHASPPRQSYEFFHPRGILKVGWMNKHLQIVPSVCVLFFDLDWDTEQWSEKVQECLSKIQCIRTSLAGRNTRVALVLLQSKTRSPLGTDDRASERAALLCSACELSSKHLFILPYIDQQLLMGYVQRLETAFFELAQQYYQGETKRVKSRKEFLNKGTHLILFIRHQFKCAFFSELRQDQTSALQHYVAAYNYLTEVAPTNSNSLELRTVAGYLNYKICRLCFRGGAPRDALTQFRKHIDQFKTIVYYSDLDFEHYSWLSKQFSIFGDLFDEAVRGQGLTPIMNQHPGFYYKQASDYTMDRRRAALARGCPAASEVFSQDIDESKVIYVGQRPWRVGYKEGQSCSPEDQQEGIFQIQGVEGRTQYSWFIVNTLSSAINHFNKHRSQRMRETLRLQLGQEYVLCGDFAKALSVLGHSMDEFRASQWWSFLVTSLKLALRCAYATAQVEDYFTLAIELLGNKYENNAEEKQRLQANVERIIANTAPEPEPGLSPEQVTKSASLWQAGMAKSWKEDRIVTQPAISVQTPQCNIFNINAMHLAPFVQCKPQFSRRLFRADEALELKVYIRTLTPKPFKFSRLEVTFADKMYAPVSTSGESSSCEGTSDASEDSHQEMLVTPGEVFTHTFRFLPPASLVKAAEIDSKIELSSIVLDVGSSSTCCARLHWNAAGSDMAIPALASSNPHLLNMWASDAGRGPGRYALWENIPVCYVAEIVNREGELFLGFSHAPPALVKEFYPVTLTIRNDEKHTVSSLQLTVSFREEAMVESSHLSLDMTTTTDRNVGSLTIDIPEMEPEKEICRTIYLQCQQVCKRTLVVSATYGMTIPSVVYNTSRELLFQKSTSIDVQSVHPFEASVKVTSLKLDSIDSVHKGEEFLLTVEVNCTSPWPITLNTTGLELSQPFAFAEDEKDVPESQLCDVHLEESNMAAECFCIVVPGSAVQKGSIPLGQFSLLWHRSVSDEESSPVPIRTFLTLPATAVVDIPFVITAVLPSHGRVRSLLPLSYTLRNQTPLTQEVEFEVESSDSFMYAGNRKSRVRVAANGHHVMTYHLYPNVPGHLALPRLRFKWARQEFDEQLLQRSLPTHVFVMPVSS